MDIVAYIRVSSTNKADHGDSVAEQGRIINAWAKRNGHRVVSWDADEGISGTTPVTERAALTRVLEVLAAHQADGLAVARMDRLGRALHVQEAILAMAWKYGAVVFTADAPGTGEVLRDDPDDPMRTAMRQMAGVFAQLERGMITMRLRGGKRAKRAAGGYIGGHVPLGYQVDGKEFVPDEAELAAVARIRELHEAGSSYRQIVAQLEAEGIRPRSAEHWSPMTVRRIALRP
jgi:DNA invertase Pin-like site-specific DNA recombinase